MARRIGRQFSFGQLKDRMTLILQSKRLFNLFEDSHSVVVNRDFRRHCSAFQRNQNRLATGMIDCIVKHLRKPILKNLKDIFGKRLQKGSYIRLPHTVLFGRICDLILPHPTSNRRQAIHQISSLSFRFNWSLRDDLLEMPVRRLPGNSEISCNERSNIRAVIVHVVQNETANCLCLRSNRLHILQCQRKCLTLSTIYGAMIDNHQTRQSI